MAAGVAKPFSYLLSFASMGYPVRIELTSNGMLILLANHYTTWGAYRMKSFSYLKSFLFRCGKRPYEWVTRWDSSMKVCLSSLLTIIPPEVLRGQDLLCFFIFFFFLESPQKEFTTHGWSPHPKNCFNYLCCYKP